MNERALFAAIIKCAIADIREGNSHAADALEFLASPYYRYMIDCLDLTRERRKRALQLAHLAQPAGYDAAIQL